MRLPVCARRTTRAQEVTAKRRFRRFKARGFGVRDTVDAQYPLEITTIIAVKRYYLKRRIFFLGLP